MNEVLREITKRCKSYEEADFLPTIFGKFRNEAVTGTMPVVLFGAGSAGKELCPVLKVHGVNPVCFCDNNPSRTGELYCGLPVISLSELRQKHKDSLIVVTTGAHGDSVKQQLVDIGFDRERVLTISSLEAMCYYTHLAQWYWPDDDLILHENELLNVYDLLSDQKSRDIFASRIALLARGADYQSFRDFISNLSDVAYTQGTNFQECMNPSYYDGEAYLQFNNDLLHLDDSEVLIDGGAFTGDSTLEFIKVCSRNNLTYGKIICFEPDPRIFAELKRNTAQYNNIALKPFGLWSHTSTIRFADSNILKPGGARIVSENDNNHNLPGDTSGLTEISTTSIDQCFPDEIVTLIKMDIEGAEMEALQGAISTIRRCRPKLLISAYHKRNDLFEIPLRIHKIVPDYKLYFRHFSSNFGDTMLFAIPSND
jgi:FkbM family methyltransferase